MKALGMLVFVLFAMIFGLGIVFAETLNGADETSCTSSEANGMHTTKSSCTDNSGTYWDYCDSGYAKNYYCTGIYNGSWYNVKCEVGGYNCPSFGKTCSDGICIYWGNESSSSGSSSTQSTTTTNTQTTSNNTATCTVYNTEEIKRNCDAYKGTYYTKTESNGCVIPYCTYPTTTTSSTYTTGTVTSFNYLSYGVYKLYVVDGASTWVKLQIKDASGNLVSTDIVNVNDVKTYTFGTTTFRVKVLRAEGAASATLAVGTDVSNAVYEASSTIASAVSTTCPTYSIEHVREKCTAYGGTLSYIKDSHGCEYPQCSFKETLKEVGTKTCPYYVVGIDEMKEKCLKYGGRFLLNTDESNCPVPKCDIQSTSTAIATPEHVAGKCFEVSDPSTNITRVVCPQTSCPAIPTDISKRCIEHNGTIVEKKDPYGCAYVACQFQNTVTSVSTNSFTGLERCPTAGEIELTLQKCQGAGLRGVVSLVGGCKVPVCSPGETKTCSGLTEETVKRVENECISKGLNAVKAHDLNGCPVYKCEESRCVKTLSQEAYDKCQSLGGEMITKRDESGCVSYSNCLTRGDERFSYTEPIKEVPDQTVLLDISLKLEQLKIKINQFTAQAEEIQKYYESSNSPEAERYKRVIGMFGGLVDKIDEIRLKLGGASLTTDGIFEIKHDIRYLKDVMLKDIVYVMLSESSDVTEIEKGEVGECSKDGNCFDASFRICKQITFEPDGQYGPVIEIKGMEGDRCVIKVEMSPERMPVGSSVKITEKMDMTCKIPNFALGIKKPQDMLRYCEGKMVDFAKGLGGIAYASGKEFPPAEGGPGGCKTIKECSTYCYNNYDSCVQWTKEHPAYGSPPPKEELKRIIDSST